MKIKTGSLNETERLEIARLLIKAGFTVSLGKEKTAGKRTYSYFVEYLDNEEIVENEV